MSIGARKLGAAVLLVLSAVAGPGLAQDPKITMLVNLFGKTAVFAPPPWVTGAAPLEQVEMFRDQGKGPNGTDWFIMEYIPKGESFEDWTELYAIHAETPLADTAEAYRNGQLGVYANACSQVFWQGANTTGPDEQVFMIYCPHYLDRPDLGEVAFFHMRKDGEMLVKNYYHKRVPAYEFTENLEQLEMTPEEIYRGIATVGVFRLE